jgi:exodeoxyribonuclease V alpha subunit
LFNRSAPSTEEAASESSNEKSFEGVVASVTYENNETGFRVVKVNVANRPRLTIVGQFPRVGVGSRVRVRGTIEVNRDHGEQLRATSVTELTPTTLAGIERYLGSGFIKGVGGVTAHKIVSQFGLDTLKVLEDQPDRLREVPGLGKRADQLIQSWNEQRAIRDVMVFLQAYGASVHLAARIFKRYGPKAVSIVSGDPYRLAIDVWGIGFRTADKIATEMGVAKDSPQRLQAAILQTLRDSTESGHCFLVVDDVIARSARLLAGATDPRDEVEPPSVEQLAQLEQALLGVMRSGNVIAEEVDSLKRIEPSTIGEGERVLRSSSIYDARMHETESRLAVRLATLAASQADALPGFASAVDRFERETGTVLADEQRLAVERAASCPLLIITGGPGVGKTTIVKAIVSVFERAGIVTRLTAPTGRAAKRMSEATGKLAMTVHRLLEFEPKTSTFKRDSKTPIDAGAIIVDESSMVDVWMGDALTQAVADGARLVLVGDVDQLPSVGPGSVLRDAIASGVVPCVRLVKIFRQAEKSLIVQNAHRINKGIDPIVPPKGTPDADFFLISKRDPDETRRLLIELVTQRIPQKFGLDPIRDIQVLTPMNRGPVGTAVLNEALQATLNPHGVGLTRGKRTFRVNDKVMQLRNDYDRNVYNGDVGIVSVIDEEEGTLSVHFDDREVEYDARALDELTLAYACTIHKAQGSEYPAVVIPLLTSHFLMLSKNLVYTAVTRGKRLVVLVADPRALRLALTAEANPKNRGGGEDSRQTKLTARIRVASS